jgi:DNA mismatch endonuclease (patch repair protein)
MTDVLTKKQRSFNMSQIKGKDTKPELMLRKLLYAKGIRGYRIHHKLPGKPDIVFIKKKIAIFVDGCFWHKCPVCFVKPKTRTEFWMKKIESNVKRDRMIKKNLEKEGWIVLRFWEHEINKSPDMVISEILRWLK